jgi:diamine N-acetyltransferase
LGPTLLWIAAAAALLYALHRLALWMEERGWLFYRHRRPRISLGVAIGAAIDGRIRQVIEARQQEEHDEDEAGDDSAPRHGQAESLVCLRPTRRDDLDFVLGLERHPDNTPFIGSWPEEEHLDAMSRADREHWIVEDAATRGRIGYLIAFDLTARACGVYVKRIVVADKGRGLGRAALAQLRDHAFDDLRAPYVWLAVFPENARAQRAYRALGFARFDLPPAELELHNAAAERTPNQSLLMVLRAPS